MAERKNTGMPQGFSAIPDNAVPDRVRKVVPRPKAPAARGRLVPPGEEDLPELEDLLAPCDRCNCLVPVIEFAETLSDSEKAEDRREFICADCLAGRPRRDGAVPVPDSSSLQDFAPAQPDLIMDKYAEKERRDHDPARSQLAAQRFAKAMMEGASVKEAAEVAGYGKVATPLRIQLERSRELRTVYQRMLRETGLHEWYLTRKLKTLLEAKRPIWDNESKSFVWAPDNGVQMRAVELVHKLHDLVPVSAADNPLAQAAAQVEIHVNFGPGDDPTIEARQDQNGTFTIEHSEVVRDGR